MYKIQGLLWPTWKHSSQRNVLSCLKRKEPKNIHCFDPGFSPYRNERNAPHSLSVHAYDRVGVTMVLRQKRLVTFFPTSPGGQLPTAELHKTNTKELTEVTSYKGASLSLCSWGGALKFLPSAPPSPKTTLLAESDHLASPKRPFSNNNQPTCHTQI